MLHINQQRTQGRVRRRVFALHFFVQAVGQWIIFRLQGRSYQGQKSVGLRINGSGIGRLARPKRSIVQEYFFGDYGKIGLVVGIGFFETVENVQENLFAEFNDYDSSEFAERTIYKIRDIAEMTEDNFKTALNDLLKK
jgi:hypothetical protein